MGTGLNVSMCSEQSWTADHLISQAVYFRVPSSVRSSFLEFHLFPGVPPPRPAGSLLFQGAPIPLESPLFPRNPLFLWSPVPVESYLFPWYLPCSWEPCCCMHRVLKRRHFVWCLHLRHSLFSRCLIPVPTVLFCTRSPSLFSVIVGHWACPPC